jgi:hypothetical protein
MEGHEAHLHYTMSSISSLEDELSVLFEKTVAIEEAPHKEPTAEPPAHRPVMDNAPVEESDDGSSTPIEVVAPRLEPTEIPELDMLHSVYCNLDAQKALITLYTDSQAECKRNGICGMEIGMAREKDQCAVLKLFLGDSIRLDIDNSLTEDFLVGKEKVSSKHSSSKVGSPVKIKWTSADTSVKEAIQVMIDADDSYYPHLLLTYMNVKEKTITAFCISAYQNAAVIKELKMDAFTVPKGNSRGIEYSRMAMKKLLTKPYFKVLIKDADIGNGIDPIERRIQILKNIGITGNGI